MGVRKSLSARAAVLVGISANASQAVTLVAIAFVVVASKPVSAQAGTDVRVMDAASTASSNWVAQNEISLTRVPGTILGNPSVLLAAYNDRTVFGAPVLGVSTSTNGGTTWANQQLPLPMYPNPNPMGFPPILTMADAFDPTVATDTQGNLYVGHISTDATVGGSSGLFVHPSTNGGMSWLPPVTVSLDIPSQFLPNPSLHRFNDRCQMVVDTVSSAGPGSFRDNIYIAWIKDRGLNQPQPFSDIYFARSTNGGASFSLATGTSPAFPGRINDENVGRDLGNTPVPAVAADGTVYVSWLDFDVSQTGGGQGRIFLDRSTDGGVTWANDQSVAQINVGPRNLNGGTKSFGAPVLAVSPFNPLELYLVYAADPAGVDQADIFFIKSTQGGISGSWSQPIRINTDSTTADQHLPWLQVRPDGTLDVVWYDRRHDVNNLNGDVFHAESIDGGSSFSPNVRINDQTMGFATPTGGNSMGEYLGLVVENSDVHVSWTASIPDLQGDVIFDRFRAYEMQVKKLIAGDGVAQDRFGNSVAISKDGTTVVVGANLDDHASANDAGSAYVFERDAGGSNNWGQVAKLMASSPAASDFFGESVVVREDGSVIVVGAFLADNAPACRPCTNAGAAYVFVRPSGGWSGTLTENAVLTASNAAGADSFGLRVSMSGNTIVVGSPGGAGGIRPGAAYVFVQPSGGWGSTNTPGVLTENARLTASGGSAADSFGSSVSISGPTAVIGAPGENSATGAAYVFVQPGGGWGSTNSPNTLTQSARLNATGGQAADFFGFSVSVNGDFAAVGAPFVDDACLPTNNPSCQSGAAYVFRGSGTNWTAEAKLTAPDAAPVDLFGISVSIDGDHVIVGALNDDDACPPFGPFGICESGSAYVFERRMFFATTPATPPAWPLRGKLTPSDAAIGDGFGGSVSIGGDTVAISSPFKGAGAAYVFLIPLVFQDTDGDGLDDDVDSQPATFSNGFGDVALGGTTTGSITARGGRLWQIFDQFANAPTKPANQGVAIMVSSNSQPATVVGNCTPVVTNTVPAGQTASFILTCGSATVQGFDGRVESAAVIGSNTVTALVVAGVTVTFELLDSQRLVVISEAGATTSVDVLVNGNRFTLPPGESMTITPTLAVVEIDPDTLSLRHGGRWINARVSLPNGDVSDIDVSTVLLNNAIAPAAQLRQGSVLLLKFDRAEVLGVVSGPGAHTLTLTGELLDGTPFAGSDVVTVIDR